MRKIVLCLCLVFSVHGLAGNNTVEPDPKATTDIPTEGSANNTEKDKLLPCQEKTLTCNPETPKEHRCVYYDAQKCDLVQQTRMAEGTETMADFAGLSFIATLFGILLLMTNISLTNQSLKIARDSQKTTQEMISIERAWLTVNRKNFTVAREMQGGLYEYYLQFGIRNTGNSPARNVKVEVFVNNTPPPQPMVFGILSKDSEQQINKVITTMIVGKEITDLELVFDEGPVGKIEAKIIITYELTTSSEVSETCETFGIRMNGVTQGGNTVDSILSVTGENYVKTTKNPDYNKG